MYRTFSEWVSIKETVGASDPAGDPDTAQEAPWLKKVRYGNYCGPGPYLNKKTCNVLRNGQPMPEPINRVDASCRQHDIDYCMCGASSSSGVLGFGNDCTYDADRRLVDALKKLDSEGQWADTGEKRAASIIKGYFQLHNAMHRAKHRLFRHWTKK